MSKPTKKAKASKTKKQPSKLPEDPISRAVAIMRESDGAEVKI